MDQRGASHTAGYVQAPCSGAHFTLAAPFPYQPDCNKALQFVFLRGGWAWSHLVRSMAVGRSSDACSSSQPVASEYSGVGVVAHRVQNDVRTCVTVGAELALGTWLFLGWTGSS